MVRETHHVEEGKLGEGWHVGDVCAEVNVFVFLA